MMVIISEMRTARKFMAQRMRLAPDFVKSHQAETAPSVNPRTPSAISHAYSRDILLIRRHFAAISMRGALVTGLQCRLRGSRTSQIGRVIEPTNKGQAPAGLSKSGVRPASAHTNPLSTTSTGVRRLACSGLRRKRYAPNRFKDHVSYSEDYLYPHR
jgi:hypothetical protein